MVRTVEKGGVECTVVTDRLGEGQHVPCTLHRVYYTMSYTQSHPWTTRGRAIKGLSNLELLMWINSPNYRGRKAAPLLDLWSIYNVVILCITHIVKEKILSISFSINNDSFEILYFGRYIHHREQGPILNANNIPPTEHKIPSWFDNIY